jgi:hypothetical protein
MDFFLVGVVKNLTLTFSLFLTANDVDYKYIDRLEHVG